jgi:hypothetical protein
MVSMFAVVDRKPAAVQHLRALGFRRGRSHDFLKIARHRFIPMALAFRSDFERGF